MFDRLVARIGSWQCLCQRLPVNFSSMIQDENKDAIVVVNAGGQYCHLIARRVREAGVRSVIREGRVRLQDLSGAKGIIISGGPNSVYEPDAPEISEDIFKANVPILGL